jgi:hypothetical protein
VALMGFGIDAPLINHPLATGDGCSVRITSIPLYQHNVSAIFLHFQGKIAA